VFLNTKEAKILRTTLEEMGHPQTPTPLQTDNTTATGYIDEKIKQRCTDAMDMQFYWVKDRVKQGQFHVYLGQGYQNLANYFTNHHSLMYHKRMREMYIHASVRPMNRSVI
jgi:predicted transposase YdaD